MWQHYQPFSIYLADSVSDYHVTTLSFFLCLPGSSGSSTSSASLLIPLNEFCLCSSFCKAFLRTFSACCFLRSSFSFLNTRYTTELTRFEIFHDNLIDNLLPILSSKHSLTAHKKGGNYFYNLYRGTGIHLHSTLGSLAFNFNTSKNDFYQISAFTHPLAKEIYWLIIKFGRNQYHIQSLTSQEEGKKL